MRSWVVEKITEAGEMVWVERPDPVPGRDEFLVRVNAAGVNFGFASGSIPELPSNRLLLKEGSALGVFRGEAAKRDPALLREVHAALLTLYRAKQVSPLIGARFALADAPLALATHGARKSVGKMVLAPSLEHISD
jgi:NADPH:quinone reductase-like Zn-dependent oxidoreductase